MKIFPRLIIGILVVFMICNSESFAQQNGRLKNDDRIVFLGDSITQAGENQKDGYVQLVRRALTSQVPGIEVIGAGISGNKVGDLQKRLKKDVIDKKPTIVVIYIGINDVWHSKNGRGTSKEDFESGLKSIIKDIETGGAKVVLCTASVIGEKTDGSNELDGMLDEYCEISRKVAKDTGVQLFDLRKAFLRYLNANNPKNKAKGILTNDGVHLLPSGNEFVAEQMLFGLMALATNNEGTEKVLRHVVLFNFKDGVTEDQIDVIVNGFGKLKGQIEEIIDYEFGTNVSPENLSQGFTHCFVVTFADEAGRDRYLPHQAHKDFVKLLGGKIEKVLVVDFWTNRVD